MPFLYTTKVLPTSITVTGAQTDYGAANLESESINRPWRSIDTTQQDIAFNFAVGKTIQAVFVSDVNFASAQVHLRIGGAAYGYLADFTTYAGKEGRRRGYLVVNTANVTALLIRILNGASTDGLAYKRIGAMYTFSAVVTLPPGPEWGYNAKWIKPRILTPLSNGQRAVASTSTRGQYHMITSRVKAFGTEDWTSFFAALDVGTCLFVMGLPAPRQWQTWAVILENDELNDTATGPTSTEFDFTLREVV